MGCASPAATSATDSIPVRAPVEGRDLHTANDRSKHTAKVIDRSGAVAEVAQLPPMGWNSWNAFRSDINEQVIKEIVEAMLDSGLVDAGYVYINIDGGWRIDDATQPDPERFPSGMKAMADYVHSKGLKFGLYTGGDSVGNEARDAQIMADYGVDFLKNDAYRTKSTDPYWEKMHKAVLSTGRPIFHSIHFNDEGTNPPNIAKMGHMWRITNDIRDYYKQESVPEDITNWAFSTLKIVDRMAEVTHMIEPGSWADPDMLEIGNGNQTIDEYKTQFTMWCLLPAPLLMGHDVRTMSDAILDLLTNEEIIAVNQDPAALPAQRRIKTDDYQLWTRELADGDLCVALLQTTPQARELRFTWDEIGLDRNETARIRDLWAHEDLGTFVNHFSIHVNPHGAAMLRLQFD